MFLGFFRTTRWSEREETSSRRELPGGERERERGI